MKFLRVKKAEVQQPNKPKPTTMLPDNMEWAWDPDAADWVAVLKDNTNTTPPLYDPNNQNVTNQTTSYMSTVKSASKKVKSFYDIKGLDNIKMELISFGEVDDLERFELDGIEFYKAKDEELENAIDICLEEEFMPDWEKEGLLSYTIDSIDYNKEDKQGVVYIDLNWGNDKINTSNKQASCLAKFLDGPQYSKEIKIEAGLIKEDLVKYAGFDFNRGTKYAITTKGLKALRKASEAEHNEALNEREKLAYMFGFNTDKETTLDTTGKTIKADDKDIIVIDTGSGYLQVFENKDTYTYGGHNVGEQLYQFDIDDESKHNDIAVLNVDDMVSKDFYTITFENFDDLEEFVWKLKEATTQKEIASLLNSKPKKVDSSKTFTITESDGSELGKVTASSKLDALVKFGIEHPEYAESLSISAKEIKSDDLYSPNHKDPKLGITIGEEERLIKQVAKDYEISEEMSEFIFGGLRGFSKDWKLNEQHIEIIAKNTYLRPIDIELIAKDFGFKIDEDKKVESQYEQTTNTKEPYPNPSETPHDDIVLENHDGWVNTASEEDGYTLPSTYLDNDLTQYHIEKFPSGKWYYWFNSPYSKRREQVGPYNTHDEAVEFLKKHHGDVSSPYEEAVQLLKKNK